MSIDHHGSSAPDDVVPVVTKRWTRFGHDRLYVSVGERQVGYFDIKAWTATAEQPQDQHHVDAAMSAWIEANRAPWSAPNVGPPPPPSPVAAAAAPPPPPPPPAPLAAAPLDPTTERLTVVRWRRHGHDRLYVNRGDERLGFVDLRLGSVRCDQNAHEPAVTSAFETWRLANPDYVPPQVLDADDDEIGQSGTEGDLKVETDSSVALSVEDLSPDLEEDADEDAALVVDLANREAGKAIADQAAALRKQAPFRTFLARLFDAKTEERAFRVGAKGERLVGDQLRRLPPGWLAIHSIPTGERGDIDHLVIGPAGVFVLNAKCHPNGKVAVYANSVYVNGFRTAYVPQARRQARTTAHRLEQALGWQPPCVGLIVIVKADDLVVKHPIPGDEVAIINRMRVNRWLQERPPVLSPEQVVQIHTVARRNDTWGAALERVL